MRTSFAKYRQGEKGIFLSLSIFIFIHNVYFYEEEI